MATQIKLPNLGENIESGDVLSILVREGDTVDAEQDLIEIETDKATMPVPSPRAGKITKILVSEGDTIEVGAPFMEIEAAEAEEKPAKKKPETPSDEKAKAPAKKTKQEEPKADEPDVEEPEPEKVEERARKADVLAGDKELVEEPTPAKAAAKKPKREKAKEPDEEEPEPSPKATKTKTPQAAAPAGVTDEDVPGDGRASSAAGPAVRRLARQLGIDLRRVRPSGAGGRITTEDLRAYVRETNEQVAATMPRGVTPPGAPDTDEFGGVRIEKLSRMRQTIARNMIQSYTTIPQLTNFDDADVTELEDMREQSKADYADRGIKLTALPFVVKAVASALKRHPVINASVDMEENQVIYKEYVNIGIAVDTERGLVVPVLSGADRKSISQIASEIDELAATVRDGKFDLEILKGGTFTISNLGAIGGTYSTPLIYPPQVAILLIGRTRTVPQIIEDVVCPRLLMPLSITYDHRLVDGAAASRFLNEVKAFLAAPGRLLLAP
jgi:pyruvate dehydrogenase E2 component (dihydrolipoamide acetyltransferase)